ncbi:hypothetical protein ANN_12644 [Periplaneta americana]|uniref:Uncharacterized protein n=1 Tax=Periplaneta americana TaxID=6978 RepID=A0ABQ8TI63_PERAM|nr:hypothetical protein ANN_12644 [Periplaneta americana]
MAGLCEGGNEPPGSLKAMNYFLQVRIFLIEYLPYRWFERVTVTNVIYHVWPSRSPDITQWDFFFWGVCEGRHLSTTCPNHNSMGLLFWGVYEGRHLSTTCANHNSMGLLFWIVCEGRHLSTICANHNSMTFEMAGHVARMDESRNAYRVLVWEAGGKRHLGRPRRRWENNIKMDLRWDMMETGLVLIRIGTNGGLIPTYAMSFLNEHAHTQNPRYWSKENPRLMHEAKNPGAPKVTVWCGILGDMVVKPYFFDGNVNKHTYEVCCTVMEFLCDLPLNKRIRILFQQDGATSHYALTVLQKQNEMFGLTGLDEVDLSHGLHGHQIFIYFYGNLWNSTFFRQSLLL